MDALTARLGRKRPETPGTAAFSPAGRPLTFENYSFSKKFSRARNFKLLRRDPVRTRLFGKKKNN